ncbi:helix-turn-helix domain-containing protein [Streptomyces sp. NPDC002463]|uniref:helix-turn-helix domain-containing protein n=1 Tax=Streptomyces sp. NPDC002463 TaxID=3364645 RepID=UPI0036B26F5B
MHNEENGHNPALAELRARLKDGLARARLNQTQLARSVDLARTTVSQALSANGPVPSEATVAALADGLKLPVDELLALRRTAEERGTAEADRVGPGRPIGRWAPHELEVHPAGPSEAAAPGARPLPGYVPRAHDRVLADAVRDAAAGRSRMVVLVGTSSTGKTRACWEAVQPLAQQGWRLWHPFHPTRAEAALTQLGQIGPRTVVWLNEAQHYFGDRVAGERIAAAVHQLLVNDKRGPVLVLGTLWPEYAHRYTALPKLGEEDPHSRVRELLAGRTQTVPDAFDAHDMAKAAAFAAQGDQLLADALTRTQYGGKVTQDLAGAPELLRRYEQATPGARALLDAAIDARRLGVGLHLPQVFLTDAASDYLSQSDYDQLTDDWAEAAYAELAEPVHGKQALLRRTTPRPSLRPPIPSTVVNTAKLPFAEPVFRLADYLEQHGRTTRRPLCPPDSFWHAAHAHLTYPDDLHNLTQAAEDRYRLQWAHHLRHRSADRGSTNALYRLAVEREEAGDRDGAVSQLRRAADRGDADALIHLADMRETAGGRDGAMAWARQAADRGYTDALVRLAGMREATGDWDSALSLLRLAADRGSAKAFLHAAYMHEVFGEWGDAELAYVAADEDTHYLDEWVVMKGASGDWDGAEALARQAAYHGSTSALFCLAVMRGAAGDWDSAGALARQAVDHGSTHTLVRLLVMRGAAMNREVAEALARQAAEYGVTNDLVCLAQLPNALNRLWPYGLNPDGTPTPPWPVSVPACPNRQQAAQSRALRAVAMTVARVMTAAKLVAARVRAVG